MIHAEVIRDSDAERSPRLTTFSLRYPKFVHGELMTHRAFSRNASSSRAVPVTKNLEEVRSDDLRAAPVSWPAEQRGMQGGEELDDKRKCVFWPDIIRALSLDISVTGEWITERETVKRLWTISNRFSALCAQIASEHGLHKSVTNRYIEPGLHINVLVTSCEPGLLNFFGLRLDRAAQPEIRVLAEAMWKTWNESKPQRLAPGEWHLPFINEEDYEPLVQYANNSSSSLHQFEATMETVKKWVSVARCARVSYTSFETGRRSTVEEDLRLYDRLLGAQPLHASPAEHQATPDGYKLHADVKDKAKHPLEWERKWWLQWDHPELHGNLPGWVQLRKTLPGEAVAPLPEEYQRG